MTEENVNQQLEELATEESTASTENQDSNETSEVKEVSLKKRGKAAKNNSAEDSYSITSPVQADEVQDSSTKLGIYKLNPNAQIPAFQTEESACFDLSAVFEMGDNIKCVSQSQQETTRRVIDRGLTVHPGERFLIPTGLVFDIPKGYCLEIYPRSGVSFKRGLSLNNCTAIIDSDYIEQVYVSINNISGGSQYIQNGERIAQAKLVKLVDTQITELDTKPTQKTSRIGGFGSTGTK